MNSKTIPSTFNFTSPGWNNIKYNGACIVTYGTALILATNKLSLLQTHLASIALSAALQPTKTFVKEKASWCLNEVYIDRLYNALPFIILGIGCTFSGFISLSSLNIAKTSYSFLITGGFTLQQSLTTQIYDFETEAAEFYQPVSHIAVQYINKTWTQLKKSPPNQSVFHTTTRFINKIWSQLLVKLLIKTSVVVNNNHTLLHAASFKGYIEVVELLIQSGAEIDKADDRGATPLHWAAKFNRKEVIELLIQSGAEIDKADACGATPLYYAVKKGRKEVVELLIQSDAEIDRADNAGQTLLHCVSQTEDGEVAKLLIQANANVNKADNNRATPVHYAAKFNRKKVVELLIQAGAEIDRVDDYEATPLQYASERKHDRIVILLKKTMQCANSL